MRSADEIVTLIDCFKMAVSAIGAHKLRSILTLVGIIAGVAAIISVMTGVSVVQSQMEAELSVLVEPYVSGLEVTDGWLQ